MNIDKIINKYLNENNLPDIYNREGEYNYPEVISSSEQDSVEISNGNWKFKSKSKDFFDFIKYTINVPFIVIERWSAAIWNIYTKQNKAIKTCKAITSKKEKELCISNTYKETLKAKLKILKDKEKDLLKSNKKEDKNELKKIREEIEITKGEIRSIDTANTYLEKNITFKIKSNMYYKKEIDKVDEIFSDSILISILGIDLINKLKRLNDD